MGFLASTLMKPLATVVSFKYLMMLWGGRFIFFLKHPPPNRNHLRLERCQNQFNGLSDSSWPPGLMSFSIQLIRREKSLGNFKLKSSSDQIHFVSFTTSKGHAKNTPKSFLRLFLARSLKRIQQKIILLWH